MSRTLQMLMLILTKVQGFESISIHENRNLLEAILIVVPDGYILTVSGPYFSDARNNDAAILREEFEIDAGTLAN